MLQTFTTKLTNKTKLTEGVYLFRFGIQGDEINFKAGQYIVLQIPKDNGFVSRLYSIASSPLIKKYFELLVKIIPGGIGSEYLNKLKIGDMVYFQGPAGLFTVEENNKNMIFFATGTGVAPFRSILTTLLSTNYNLQTTNYNLFWGLPYFNDLYLFDELKNLSQKYPNFKFHVCLSREKDLLMVNGEDSKYFILGRVDRGFDNVYGKLQDFNYYICGTRQITESLRAYLLGKGINKEEIYFEKY